jgi:hypothetical protein
LAAAAVVLVGVEVVVVAAALVLDVLEEAPHPAMASATTTGTPMAARRKRLWLVDMLWLAPGVEVKA